jgi:hypothetical protein
VLQHPLKMSRKEQAHLCGGVRALSLAGPEDLQWLRCSGIVFADPRGRKVAIVLIGYARRMAVCVFCQLDNGAIQFPDWPTAHEVI